MSISKLIFQIWCVYRTSLEHFYLLNIPRKLATLILGGMLTNIRTWSGIKWPSITQHLYNYIIYGIFLPNYFDIDYRSLFVYTLGEHNVIFTYPFCVINYVLFEPYFSFSLYNWLEHLNCIAFKFWYNSMRTCMGGACLAPNGARRIEIHNKKDGLICLFIALFLTRLIAQLDIKS